MQTPKEKGNVVSSDTGHNVSIVPLGLRRYSEEEISGLRAKFAREVYAEHAGKLQTYQGVRLWWLKQRLDWKVETRIRESQNKGL